MPSFKTTQLYRNSPHVVPNDKTMPLSSDACANGTRTNQAAGAIRRYAPRTFAGSSLVNPMRASARNAKTAPIQPTDDVR